MVTHWYLDSSVGVRILLGHSASARRWFDTTTADDQAVVVSSRLLRTELTRVLRREQLPVALRDEVLDYVSFIPLNEAILAHAESIVAHIKTLDAVHLASLVHTGLDATVVTHDATMAGVAATLGYPVLDPT
jgi:predicted nucleic acid-binding protein